MNNELGRKITSLTLMTIMVAGGLTFAIPGVMPEAYAANANLFVSAENSQFDNYMSGPQVIEVVVIDSDIDDTDEAKGEPDVTVNGKILRMAQAVDGNWYGYFADRDQALIADSTQVGDLNNPRNNGFGLDFGTFCSDTSGTSVLGFSVTDSDGFAIPTSGGSTTPTNTSVGSGAGYGINGTASGGPITVGCSEIDYADTQISTGTANVVREAKDLNQGSATVGIGQIGFNATTYAVSEDALWPFIQLYQLNPTGNVVIQYNKGGGVQTTTLTFDTVDNFAELELDRSIFPQGSEVHATVTDLWLNIDPTDEDSWSWATNSSDTTGTFYQVFDENGQAHGDTSRGSADISNMGSKLMLEGNGVLLLDTDVQNTGSDIVAIQDNDDTALTVTDINDAATASSAVTFARNSQPVTLTEQGPNSGVFGTYDESDVSVLRVTDDAPRGTSASLDYNDAPTTVLVGHGDAKLDIQPITEVWSSGEEIPVVLVDSDANKNSRADEDLDLNNPAINLIPALSTGDPFTIGESGAQLQAAFYNDSLRFHQHSGISNVSASAPSGAGQVATPAAVNATINVERFSERAVISPNATPEYRNVTGLIIDLETDMGELRASLGDAYNISGTSEFRGTNLLNFDLRGLNSTLRDIEIGLIVNSFDGGEIIFEQDGNTFIGNQSNPLSDDGDTHPLSGYQNLTKFSLINSTSPQGLVSLDTLLANEFLFGDRYEDGDSIGLIYNFTTNGQGPLVINQSNTAMPIVTDFFSFGFTEDGDSTSERTANQIIRFELEESGDNTNTFVGSVEYTMINQLNILDQNTYDGLSTVADDPSFIVIEDLTDEDAPRINYLDLRKNGAFQPVADQEEAPSHSGVVSFDLDTYKQADTVTVSLVDSDLNVDSDLIDIFTVVSTANDTAFDAIGLPDLPSTTRAGDEFSFGPLGRLLDITFDDEIWADPNFANSNGVTCRDAFIEGGFDGAFNLGLGDTGFSLIETEKSSGSFLGDFQIPDVYCKRSGNTGADGTVASVTGVDIEVNYVDFRDASGEIIEVGDSAGVRANTGTISLDRTVYPVPWGMLADFGGDTRANTPNEYSVFPVHATGITGNVDDQGSSGSQVQETLGSGDLTIHVRVSDPDYDISASGEDTIAQDVLGQTHGPVKITVSRGADEVVLAYAGGSTPQAGTIDVGDDNPATARHLGEIKEIAPDAGVFELDFTIRYTDGPASATCPETTVYQNLGGGSGTDVTDRFSEDDGDDYCILQGDILTVEYTDPTDASGDPNTVTDSATFDLRNGVLQSDKSVYIIGGDMILTVIEPDWDLDNDAAETYDLDIIEWDSDAATLTMGNAWVAKQANFDPEPTDFQRNW